MQTDTKLERALISTDALGLAVVLSVDSATIWYCMNEFGTNAEEIGLVPLGECDHPGFYLWEGFSRLMGHDIGEPDFVFDGTVRLVETMEELTALHSMRPALPPEDDREEIRPGDAHLYYNGGSL